MAKTYTALKADIKALEAKAQAARLREIHEVVEKVRVAYGLTTKELGFKPNGSFAPTAQEPNAKKPAAKKRTKRQRMVRYANGAEEWVGMGRRPPWLRELLEQGHALDEYKLAKPRPAA